MIYYTKQGYAIEIDREDYNRIKQYNWYKKSTGFTNENKQSLGRFLLNYHGELEVDHKDRNQFNNKKDNLRIATRQQQLANRGPLGSNDFKGVSWDKSKKTFRVHICVDRKIKHIGCFKDEVEAAHAYDKVARETWGEFAYLNFPDWI